MSHQLLEYFSRFTDLSSEEYQALEESIHQDTKTYPKGSYLLKEGQKPKNSYFIVQGLVREYILHEGEEQTTYFFSENQWVISLTSFSSEIPSDHYWVCMEDTTLVEGNEEKAQILFNRFPRFESISRKVIEQAFYEQKQMATTYRTDSPTRRYLRLMESHPDLFQRVPQHFIASFIGVKPESLSRLRSRLASQPHRHR